MELLTLKIRQLSAFSTIPKGDTIFGQIVAYDFLNGNKTFENYLDEKPKLIVSDMMPFGYVYRPTLPIEYFKEANEAEADKKDIRKRKFIKIEHLQNGEFTKCEKVEFENSFTTIRNSINRTNFTTDGAEFAPYGVEERSYFKELWLFIMVESSIKNKALELITQIGRFGFGKDANIGKGAFEIKEISSHIKGIDSNYYMSISPTILHNANIKNCWYEPFTRFGKFGLANAHENAFKKPVLMCESGAVIKSSSKISYFGKSLNNGNIKPSFLQGYSIALPIKIKDEKWLDTK